MKVRSLFQCAVFLSGLFCLFVGWLDNNVIVIGIGVLCLTALIIPALPAFWQSEKSEFRAYQDFFEPPAGFQIARRFAGADGRSVLAFDETARRIFIADRSSGNRAILAPTDLLNVSSAEDGYSVSKSSTGSVVGRALAGNIIAGGLGAVVGGATARRTTHEVTTHLALKLQTSDAAHPLWTIPFLRAPRGASTRNLQKAGAEMEQWRALLAAFKS